MGITETCIKGVSEGLVTLTPGEITLVTGVDRIWTGSIFSSSGFTIDSSGTSITEIELVWLLSAASNFASE